jgi:hypothetical protein
MTPAGSTPSATRSDAEFVNRVFRSLQAIFPAWKSAFADDASVSEARRQWTMGLVEAGLTNPEAIRAGLAIARRHKSPFMPSVGQFIGWCQEAAKERMGFPSLDSAIVQIDRFMLLRPRGEPCEIHPAAYWIYTQIDSYALRRADAKAARQMVEVIYRDAEAKAIAGFEFQPAPMMIEEKAPEPVVLSAAEKAQRMAEMRRQTGI